MHSLSFYDMGKKAAEGARYNQDLSIVYSAMGALMAPMKEYNARRVYNKQKKYSPRMVLTLGNHENRINRYVNDYPQLANYLSTANLHYEDFGWEVHEFLEPVVIDGIKYAHFFPRGPNGRVMQSHRGAPSARAQVMREGMSCTAGHLQGLDWSVLPNGSGANYGLIAGSCYLHEEDFLTPQGTQYWRGIIMCHQVTDGNYDPMFLSLDYLERRYG